MVIRKEIKELVTYYICEVCGSKSQYIRNIEQCEDRHKEESKMRVQFYVHALLMDNQGASALFEKGKMFSVYGEKGYVYYLQEIKLPNS